MDYVTIGLYLAITANIWVTISLLKGLSQHIEELLREMVEDLPPALGEAVSGSMGQLAEMPEVNPIQMAIAQLIPNLLEPKIQVKEIGRDSKGQFQSDNL